MKKDKNGKNYPTYRGHKLQQICVETKEQFKIFKEFNQENFNKNVLDNIFEDKLQHSEKQQIYNPYIYNQKNQLKKRLNTIDHYQSPKSIKQRLYTEKAETIKNDKRINTRGTSNDSIKFPNIIMTFRNEKSKNKKNYLNLQKLSIKKIISGEQMAEIRTIFNRIGGYQKVKAQSIITKQSIVKYLKRFYEKPYRIIDFLEIKPVITFEQYAHISKKIKVMQMQHFMFLTFLFYDTNNDGIICEGDLMRLQNLSKIYTFLNEDYKKLIMAKFQQKTTKIPDYYELYGLSQITQSIYFNWNKSYKNSKQEQNIVNTEQSIQIDTKILNLKRKKFSIDFYKFKKIFQHAKPLLWYELMFRLNGTRYQGLIYKQ